MVDDADNFWENEESEDDDEEIVVDECICNECKGVFHVPLDAELDECPLCGCKFD